MDQFTALGVARTEFERRLRAVGPGDWDRATPCAEWNVRDLVVHVLGGTRMAAALVDGCSREDAVGILASEPFPDDVGATFTEVADAQARAFSQEGALERTCAHPAGDFPGTVLLGFRIGDYALHAWDLARAIGADETLPDELVTHVWDAIQPMVPIIGSIGVFGEGPSGTVAEDAPLQMRLLDVMGRRP
ncbi:MAG: TIGR03086 family metal-binding protein [Acidimicrobiia bacterium]